MEEKAGGRFWGAREAGEEEEELKKRGIRAKKEHRRAVERNKRSTHALWAPLSTPSQQARDTFSQGRKIRGRVGGNLGVSAQPLNIRPGRKAVRPRGREATRLTRPQAVKLLAVRLLSTAVDAGTCPRGFSLVDGVAAVAAVAGTQRQFLDPLARHQMAEDGEDLTPRCLVYCLHPYPIKARNLPSSPCT
jgi:hypothetical protein